jgi:hypothetical protein
VGERRWEINKCFTDVSFISLFPSIAGVVTATPETFADCARFDHSPNRGGRGFLAESAGIL